MATLKYRLNRKNSSGSYDTIHYETSSNIVLRPSGRTVEQDLEAYLPRTQSTDDVPQSLVSGAIVSGVRKAWIQLNEGIQELVDLDSPVQKFKLYSLASLVVGNNFIPIPDFVPTFCFVSTMPAQGGNGGSRTNPVYTVVVNDGEEHVWCINFDISHYAKLHDSGLNLRVVSTTNRITLPVRVVAFKE